MKMVMAIVRTMCLEHVVKSLEEIGIKEMTISEIKGIGEQVQLFEPYTIHNKMEIIIPDEKVDETVDMILKHVHLGLPGDGLVAIFPLDYMIKIRTKEKII